MWQCLIVYAPRGHADIGIWATHIAWSIHELNHDSPPHESTTDDVTDVSARTDVGIKSSFTVPTIVNTYSAQAVKQNTKDLCLDPSDGAIPDPTVKAGKGPLNHGPFVHTESVPA